MIKNSVNPRFMQQLASKANIQVDEDPDIDTKISDGIDNDIITASASIKSSISSNQTIIKKQFIEIICDTLGVDESECSDNTSLDDLGADSLDAVEIMMIMESHFGIKVADEETRYIRTIGDALALILRKKGL